jgi:hypothetical protein
VESPRQRQHSEDGLWWWSGSQWTPAWSVDRQWWFNGASWIRVARARSLPKPSALECGIAIAWSLLWVVAVVWWAVLDHSQPAPDRATSSGLLHSGLAVGVSALVLLSVCGDLLARAQRWSYVGALIGYVSALLIALYVVAMLTAPTEAGTSNDTAAAAGLVILGIPLVLFVTTFVGLGAGTSVLVGALSRWRSGCR